MNRINGLLLGVMFAFGCSGEYDEDGAEMIDDAGVIGEVSADGFEDVDKYQTGVSVTGLGPSSYHAVRYAGNELQSCRSNQSDNGNRCYFRGTRSVVFCVNPSGWANAAERDAVRAALNANVAAILAQANTITRPPGVNAWTMTTQASGQACSTASVKVSKADLSASGDLMGNFVQVAFEPGSGATLVANDFGVAGSFYSTSATAPPSILIDKVGIDARGANASEDNLLLQHAVSLGALASLGVGYTTVAGNNNGVATQRTAAPITGFSEMTPGQACRLQHFDITTGGNGEYRRSFSTEYRCVE